MYVLLFLLLLFYPFRHFMQVQMDIFHFYNRNTCKTFFLFVLYLLLIPNWFIQRIVLVFHWNRIPLYGYALLLKTIHYWHTCMIVSKLLLLCTFLINYIIEHFPYAWYLWNRFLKVKYLKENVYSFVIFRSIDIGVEQFTPSLILNNKILCICQCGKWKLNFNAA